MRRRDPGGRRTRVEDDRAVSEVVGFAITFGIIILSVGLLTVVGFGSMGDYSEGEQLRNAELAMDALVENFDDVAKYDGVHERAGELALRGGSLSIEEGGTLQDDDGNGEINVSLARLAYEYEGTTIAYEGGAVVRSEGDGSVVVREPMVHCDDGGIATFVTIDGTDQGTIQSGGTQPISMAAVVQEDGSTTRVYDDGGYDLDVEDSFDAWNSTLDDCDDVDVVRIVPVEIDYGG